MPVEGLSSPMAAATAHSLEVDLNRVWIGVVECGIQINGKTVQKEFSRNTLWVKSFGVDVFRDPPTGWTDLD